MNNSQKIGFVGFGEINSPRDLIENKCRNALNEIKSLGFKVVSTDVVTDDPEGNDVKRALFDLKDEDFDIIIICLAGWIPSHAVISITERYKEKPMILWGLAGDKVDNRIVTAAAQAGTTALRKVFQDLKYYFKYFYNVIGKPSPLNEIRDFVQAAFTLRAIKGKKVGMMGFRDMKLYNTLYEGMSLKSKLGVDVEFFEMLEMVQKSNEKSDGEGEAILNKIMQQWEFVDPMDEEFLKRGIKYYLAIKDIAERSGFDAISLKDVDGMKKILSFPPAFLFMLLADEMKICTIPENDTMGSVTQLIMRQLTGQVAAYLEFYEFFEKSVLMGVPDYIPSEVTEGKVRVLPAAFGKISGGLLNVSKMKTGKLTLARLSNNGEEYTMHACIGESKLIHWEEAGWNQPAPQLPSLEIFLDQPVAEFVQNISGQHYIIAYGDHLQSIADFCYLKDIKLV